MTKERFLELYGNIETEVKQVYGVEIIEINEIKDRNNLLYKYRNDFNLFRQIRNILVHHVIDESTQYIAVNDLMEERMLKVREKIFGKIHEICVKQDLIFTCQMNELVINALTTMNKKDYTHVPVLDEEGKLIGVFSENTLLKIIAKNGTHEITSDTQFKDISNYLAKPDDDKTMFDFVKGSEYIHNCSNLFGRAHYDKYRLDILFITEDGTKDTPLEGLITVWDLAGKM